MRRASVAVLLIGWALAQSALAQDFDRGRLLYEFACDACHDKGVHQRTSRKATTFAELRSYVVRWNKELGTQWTDDEIDQVSRYLNARYYRFPCPPNACPNHAAAAH